MKTPPEHIFYEMKSAAILIWSQYDNTHGYVTEKLNIVNRIINLQDNAMAFYRMFDYTNQQKNERIIITRNIKIYNRKPMTSTPEETPENIKFKLSHKYNYSVWDQVLDAFQDGFISRDDFDNMENEAMQEYHKQMVEQAAGELPNADDLNAGDYFSGLPKIQPVMYQSFLGGAQAMKEQTALVVLKERCKYAESIRQNDMLQERLQEINNDVEELLIELKSFCKRVDSGEIRSVKTYSRFKELLQKHKQ